jgi:hypothetical protein
MRRANFGQTFVQRPPVGLGRQQAADLGVLAQPQPLVGVVEHSRGPFQVKDGADVVHPGRVQPRERLTPP